MQFSSELKLDLISGADELVNGVGKMLRVRNLDISFRNKLMTTFYQISALPFSSLFNSAEFKDECIEENRQ